MYVCSASSWLSLAVWTRFQRQQERMSPNKQECGQWAKASHATEAKPEEERVVDAVSSGEKYKESVASVCNFTQGC